MGIAKYLKSGKIKINPELQQIENLDSGCVISYSSIKPEEWGQIYEKFVGQVYESEGYEVIYQGLNKGLTDRGIDLIVTKDKYTSFIQCKFSRNSKKINKQRVEWILYKSSQIIFDYYKLSGRKPSFILIVHSIDESFSKLKRKDINPEYLSSKVTYPLVKYFLDHNHRQDKVKLELREIQMDI